MQQICSKRCYKTYKTHKTHRTYKCYKSYKTFLLLPMENGIEVVCNTHNKDQDMHAKSDCLSYGPTMPSFTRSSSCRYLVGRVEL